MGMSLPQLAYNNFRIIMYLGEDNYLPHRESVNMMVNMVKTMYELDRLKL